MSAPLTYPSMWLVVRKRAARRSSQRLSHSSSSPSTFATSSGESGGAHAGQCFGSSGGMRTCRRTDLLFRLRVR